MKTGAIISSNDAETCWNALRYANYSLGQKDEVKVFLIGKGVEYEKASSGKYNTVEQSEKFLHRGENLRVRHLHQGAGAEGVTASSRQHHEGFVRHRERKRQGGDVLIRFLGVSEGMCHEYRRY